MNARRLFGLMAVPLLFIGTDGAAQQPPQVSPAGAQRHALEFAACRPGVERIGGGTTTCRAAENDLPPKTYDTNFFVEQSAQSVLGHPSCVEPLADPLVPAWYVPAAGGGGWVQPPRDGDPFSTPISYQVGDFTYRVYFSIPDDPSIFSAVDIGGAVAADDQVTVVLNDTSSQSVQLLDCGAAGQDCRASRMLYRSSDKVVCGRARTTSPSRSRTSGVRRDIPGSMRRSFSPARARWRQLHRNSGRSAPRLH